jgi:hypothetical protein
LGWWEFAGMFHRISSLCLVHTCYRLLEANLLCKCIVALFTAKYEAREKHIKQYKTY